MFISENTTADDNKYKFADNITGTTLTCQDINYAVNTGNITVEKTATSVQVLPAIKKLDFGLYAVIEGAKQKILDGQQIGCDYVEIVEHYQIMNPALIGKALRDARPQGGYSENQSLAIGAPIVDFNMTYRISSDGTVVSEFEHTILENVKFDWYGGVMHQLRDKHYLQSSTQFCQNVNHAMT